MATTGVTAEWDEQAAIEAGRESLAGRGDYPWYDDESEGIRRLDVAPPEDLASHRNSTWEASVDEPAADGSLFWEYFWATLKWLAWSLLLVLLVLLVMALVRAFLRSESGRGWQGDSDDLGSGRSEEDLIESLPFQVDRPRTDLLGEATRQYELGQYGQAIIYLFSYQLVKLDQHHAIRLARGKTNRQYLRELHSQPNLRAILERTMIAFEDVFFGHHTLERQRFESCWFALDEFQRVLQPST